MPGSNRRNHGACQVFTQSRLLHLIEIATVAFVFWASQVSPEFSDCLVIGLFRNAAGGSCAGQDGPRADPQAFGNTFCVRQQRRRIGELRQYIIWDQDDAGDGVGIAFFRSVVLITGDTGLVSGNMHQFVYQGEHLTG